MRLKREPQRAPRPQRSGCGEPFPQFFLGALCDLCGTISVITRAFHSKLETLNSKLVFMSKAFTRESDESADSALPVRPASSLPPGVNNYVTAAGLERLRAELDRIRRVERPGVAQLPADNPNKRHQLQALDQRIVQLAQSLSSAVPVGPPA